MNEYEIRYQHWKGGIYLFLYIATHSETGEELVVYQSDSDYRVWIRPMEMFFGTVEVNGVTINRFERI